MSSPYPDDDLFEKSKMSFGEHLEELRVALFKAIIGLVIGVLIGLAVGKYVVGWIEAPLKDALAEFYMKSATVDLQRLHPDGIPPEMLAMITEEEMVPMDIQIDPIQFLVHLKQADPEMFGPLVFKPHRIGQADISAGQVAAFCKQLKAKGKGDNGSPAKHLWSLLDSDQQTEIKSLAKAEVSADSVAKLRVILNKLLDQSDLHSGKAFVDLSGLDANTQLIVDRIHEELGETPDADKSRRLNRLLLAGAFPQLLRKPRLPLIDLPTWKPVKVKVQTLNAQEGFMIWLKASMVTGAVIASPWIFWQVWLFVAAGLYPAEQKYVYIYMPFSLLLFASGVLLAFNYVFQPVLEFLFDFNLMLGLDPSPRISEWLSFVLFLPLGFGISFQLPLVMLFMQRIGIMTTGAYLSKWRIAILVICVISMLLTPADPMSMMLMAIPLTLLYFAGILLCIWMPRTKNPFAEAEDI